MYLIGIVWFDCLKSLSKVDPILPLISLSFPYASPTLWDHSPFAYHLYNASKGKVCHNSVNLSSCMSSIKHDFFSDIVHHQFKSKIQKHLSVPIKSFYYPDNTLSILSFKASKQQIILSPSQISSILSSLAKHPFILSATCIKGLTNALCITSRIKNRDTLQCFACGKYRDDLYHFIRCPYVAFIFSLPPAYGTLHIPPSYCLDFEGGRKTGQASPGSICKWPGRCASWCASRDLAPRASSICPKTPPVVSINVAGRSLF